MSGAKRKGLSMETEIKHLSILVCANAIGTEKRELWWLANYKSTIVSQMLRSKHCGICSKQQSMDSGWAVQQVKIWDKGLEERRQSYCSITVKCTYTSRDSKLSDWCSCLQTPPVSSGLWFKGLPEDWNASTAKCTANASTVHFANYTVFSYPVWLFSHSYV